MKYGVGEVVSLVSAASLDLVVSLYSYVRLHLAPRLGLTVIVYEMAKSGLDK